MNAQIAQWVPRVGAGRACRAFGVSQRTYNHRLQASQGRLARRPSRAKPAHQRLPVPWAIPQAQRDHIRQVLCSQRFGDLAPAQAHATLLDEGRYLCSERSMYRILHEHDLVRERRRGHRRRGHAPHLVHAEAPNQAWTWDISRLRGPVLRCWYYLYVVLDIFSRKIVAWSIETVESDKVAKRLITQACTREGIEADTLVLHSDRGAQMTSGTIAELLEDRPTSRSDASTTRPPLQPASSTSRPSSPVLSSES